MSDFPVMEYRQSDEQLFHLAPGETSLSSLLRVYAASRSRCRAECSRRWLGYPTSILKLGAVAQLA